MPNYNDLPEFRGELKVCLIILIERDCRHAAKVGVFATLAISLTNNLL
jgi:hypothetical protein